MATDPLAVLARQHLSYDPETGEFTWLTRRSANALAGSKAGSLMKTGYIEIGFQVGKKRYRTTGHRLAWLFMTGGWPTHDVDHKNRIKSDNRWDNLREATKSQNLHNSNRRPKGLPRGVQKQALSNTYMARITVNGERIYIGTYPTPSLASEAYESAFNRLVGAEWRADAQQST